MKKLLPIILILFSLLVAAVGYDVAAAQAPTCTTVVNPGGKIQTAVSNAGPGAVICVRAGVYHETVTIRAKSNLTLMKHPDDTERPIIDGQYVLPTSEWSPLLSITNQSSTGTISTNIVVDGFEIRNSAGRGLVVSGGSTGVTLRNLSVHDSWGTGLLATGTTVPPIVYVEDVVVENSDVYRNIRKAAGAPWVVRGARPAESSSATAWAFELEQVWNNRYWSGYGTDLPSPSLAEISFQYDGTEVLERVYVTVGNDKSRTVDAPNSGTGQTFAFDARDILFQHQVSRKWTPYFDGSALGLGTDSVAIDAFEVLTPTVGLSETVACQGCYPILMSFNRVVTLPDGVGLVGAGDIIEFTPTDVVSTTGQIVTGTYALYRTAADLGIGTANVDSLAVLPDGRLVISTAADAQVGGISDSVSANDLIAGDWGDWELFFDADKAAGNPYRSGLTSISLDPDGGLLISGNPVGGSGLVLLGAQDSVARGNRVYHNHGEGLVLDRWSDRVTAEDNVVWDNDHASLYLNGVTYPLVQRNLVYCTDDREFWEKSNQLFYRAPPGFILRDEDFKGVNPPTSRGQIIINNTVVGCNTNFGVYAQPDSAAGGPRGGLANAIVAHNTFVTARGDGPPYFGVQLGNSAKYIDSTFANNIILQPEADKLATKVLNLSESGFIVSHNLYSGQPVDWYQVETGRIVADPLLSDPVLPVMGTPFNAAGYLPATGSPAIDAAAPLPGLLYAGGEQNPPDRGVDVQVTAAPRPGTIVIQLANDPTQDTVFSFTSAALGNFTLQGASNAYREFTGLEAGTYVVSQNLPAGWDFRDLACSAAPDDTSSISGRTVTIDLDPNETVTCTFVNYQKRGTITVRAETDPDGAAASFTFDPSWSSTHFSLTDGQSSSAASLLAGTYSVAPKNLPNGWSVIDANCGPDVDPTMPEGIVLEPGGEVECTFTFQLARGRVVLRQETTPITTTAFIYTADWRTDPVSLAHGGTFTSTALLPGEYAVEQQVAAADWTLAAAACDDDNSSSPGAIVLDPGEIVTCTFSHTYDLAGRVIVEKQTVPDDGTTTFTFAPSWGERFSLRDGQSADSGLLLPGEYGVSMADLPAGWLASGVDCGGQVANGIDLAPSQTVTCVFTSTLGATITVAQQTDPAGDPTSFGYGVSWSATGLSLSHGDSESSGLLLPGSYSITPDELPDGWTQTSVDCGDGIDPAAIELAPGEDVVCTFTNTLTRGSITVAQQTDPAGDPTSFGYGVSWSATGLSLSHGDSESSGPLLPGSYSITPDELPDGWALTSVDCGDGIDPAAIELAPGENVVCTFTHSLTRGSIIIKKVTVGANDSTQFTFDPSWSATNFTLANGAQQSSGPLLPGTYAVAEISIPTGWTLTDAGCDDGSPVNAISLSAGETVTCTFTNRYEMPPVAGTRIYVSATKTGSVTGGPSFAMQDVLTFDLPGATWGVALRGASVGLTRNVNALAILPDGSYLLSLSQSQVLPMGGVSATVRPQDVIRYVPPSSSTAGRFEWYLQGSRVGLTTSGEIIDALALAPDGRLLVSTAGAASVSCTVGSAGCSTRSLLKAADEDLIVYSGTTGPQASGRWAMYFDGSTIKGMAVEDVVGASVDAETGTLYATILGAFNVGGVRGNSATMLAINRVGSTYQVSVYPRWPVSSYKGTVDAFEIVNP